MGASNTANLYVPTNIATTNTITWYDNKHSAWQKNTVVVRHLCVMKMKHL